MNFYDCTNANNFGCTRLIIYQLQEINNYKKHIVQGISYIVNNPMQESKCHIVNYKINIKKSSARKAKSTFETLATFASDRLPSRPSGLLFLVSSFPLYLEHEYKRNDQHMLKRRVQYKKGNQK